MKFSYAQPERVDPDKPIVLGAVDAVDVMTLLDIVDGVLKRDQIETAFQTGVGMIPAQRRNWEDLSRVRGERHTIPLSPWQADGWFHLIGAYALSNGPIDPEFVMKCRGMRHYGTLPEEPTPDTLRALVLGDLGLLGEELLIAKQLHAHEKEPGRGTVAQPEA